jgi:hypothetical protein
LSGGSVSHPWLTRRARPSMAAADNPRSVRRPSQRVSYRFAFRTAGAWNFKREGRRTVGGMHRARRQRKTFPRGYARALDALHAIRARPPVGAERTSRRRGIPPAGRWPSTKRCFKKTAGVDPRFRGDDSLKRARAPSASRTPHAGPVLHHLQVCPGGRCRSTNTRPSVPTVAARVRNVRGRSQR